MSFPPKGAPTGNFISAFLFEKVSKVFMFTLDSKGIGHVPDRMVFGRLSVAALSSMACWEWRYFLQRRLSWTERGLSCPYNHQVI